MSIRDAGELGRVILQVCFPAREGYQINTTSHTSFQYNICRPELHPAVATLRENYFTTQYSARIRPRTIFSDFFYYARLHPAHYFLRLISHLRDKAVGSTFYYARTT